MMYLEQEHDPPIEAMKAALRGTAGTRSWNRWGRGWDSVRDLAGTRTFSPTHMGGGQR